MYRIWEGFAIPFSHKPPLSVQVHEQDNFSHIFRTISSRDKDPNDGVYWGAQSERLCISLPHAWGCLLSRHDLKSWHKHRKNTYCCPRIAKLSFPRILQCVYQAYFKMFQNHLLIGISKEVCHIRNKSDWLKNSWLRTFYALQEFIIGAQWSTFNFNVLHVTRFQYGCIAVT